MFSVMLCGQMLDSILIWKRSMAKLARLSYQITRVPLLYIKHYGAHPS